MPASSRTPVSLLASAKSLESRSPGKLPVGKLKTAKDSRVFEQINLHRLERCSQSVSHAKDVIAQSKRQVEIVHRARGLRQGIKSEKIN